MKDMMLSTLEEEVLLIISTRENIYGWRIKYILSQAYNLESWQVDRSYGSLYPCLNRLEKRGYITYKWGDDRSKGGRRKYYSITEGGLQALELRNSLRKRLITIAL